MITLAGHVARSRKWDDFDKGWARLMRRYSLEFLHTKHLVKGAGPFSGWSVRKHLRFIDRVAFLEDRHVLCGFSFSMKVEDYRIAYRLPGKGIQLDSAYGLLFRLLVREIVLLLKRTYPGDRRLLVHVLLEDGHRNAGDAVKIWKEEGWDADIGPFMGSISFGEKTRYPGLQLADSLAHMAYRTERDDRVAELVLDHVIPPTWNIGDTKEGTDIACPRYRFELTPEILGTLRGDLDMSRQHRKAWWDARFGNGAST